MVFCISSNETKHRLGPFSFVVYFCIHNHTFKTPTSVLGVGVFYIIQFIYSFSINQNQMAIINSVLIGKGRGKVGNVVLSNLKGQTLMRSVPQKAKKPPTPEQINRNNMLTNSVQIYKIFKQYLRFTYKARDLKKSTYNTFVSRVISIFDTMPVLNYQQLYDQIEQFSYYFNHTFDISMSIEGSDKIIVEFPPFTGFITGKFRVVCYYNKAYDAQPTVYTRKLTFEELWAGRLVIPCVNAYLNLARGAYIYSQDKKVLSSVTFY